MTLSPAHLVVARAKREVVVVVVVRSDASEIKQQQQQLRAALRSGHCQCSSPGPPIPAQRGPSPT